MRWPSFGAFLSVALLCFVAPRAWAACESHDYRREHKGGIVIEAVALNSETLTSAELLPVKTQMVGSCFNDSSEEIGERIEDQLQQQGYFKVKVDHVEIKTIDALATPKPVTVSADIVAGKRTHLAELKFTGNRAFTSEELAAQFSMKAREAFNTAKVRSGLDLLRKVYDAAGYLEAVPIPDVLFRADGGVVLTIDIDEGTRYRLEKVEVVGDSRNAAILSTKWQMRAGEPFDAGYVRKFLDENHALLPDGFSSERDVEVAQNCPDGVVEVRIVLARSDKVSPLRQKLCEKRETAKKGEGR